MKTRLIQLIDKYQSNMEVLMKTISVCEEDEGRIMIGVECLSNMVKDLQKIIDLDSENLS